MSCGGGDRGWLERDHPELRRWPLQKRRDEHQLVDLRSGDLGSARSRIGNERRRLVVRSRATGKRARSGDAATDNRIRTEIAGFARRHDDARSKLAEAVELVERSYGLLERDDAVTQPGCVLESLRLRVPSEPRAEHG
jgi:hypothetical protein